MELAGTHLPVLRRVIEITHGPVLEMGMGNSSTPILARNVQGPVACVPRQQRSVEREVF